MDLPPTTYDHPYPGQVIEMRMTTAQVNSLCLKMGANDPGGFFIGCSWLDISKRCYIVVSDDNYAAVRRHEMAHCNGWKHD